MEDGSATSTTRSLGTGAFEPTDDLVVGDVSIHTDTNEDSNRPCDESSRSNNSNNQTKQSGFMEISQQFFDASEVPLDLDESKESFDQPAANGSGQPSEQTRAASKVATSTTESLSIQSERNNEYPRRPSEEGSVPLKRSSLEIINGLSPGEPLPDDDFYRPVKKDPGQSIKKSVVLSDFLNDDPSEMTYSRRIALFMMKKRWYNPRVDEPVERGALDDVIDGGKFRSEDGYPITQTKTEIPSLEKAWAYFEHVALPRYLYVEKQNSNQKNLCTRIIRKFSKANKQMTRAEPGEDDLPTKLYSPLFTPHKQLGDWGLGIGLYFSTIRALTLLVVVAGIIHTPNFIYFSGPEYSANQTEVESMLLKGSAICTETDWVPCPNCTTEEFVEGLSLLIEPISEDQNLTFARRNLCNGATVQQGMVNYASLIFVIFGSFVLSKYLKHMEVQFDEDEQTAQDYSIMINNPPPDATDPKEWKEYFKNAFNAHVTGCTVAVDNDLLVNTLVERREKMRMIELMVEPGTNLDIVTLAGIAAGVERERSLLQKLLAFAVPGIPEIFDRLAVLTIKVQGLAQQDYPVTNVFITFETETSQRRVLEQLTVGQRNVDKNNQKSVADPKYLFRGFRVLSVKEPEEPDSIRWEDLNIGLFSRMKQQFFTAMATVAALVVVTILVNVVNDWNSVFTAYTIAITNAVFPLFAKFLTYNESHPSYGSLQTSLYFKIAIFRWCTTAIVITIITPFENTVFNGKGGLIFQIQAQFVAEITTTAALQILDPVGHLQRHFLAPRAQTQDAMNLLMQGTKFELAERYTAVAKLLFLTLWYCSIYPGTFFFCAFALQVIYYMDKFSLTRTWKRVPRLGPTISKFNRTYFLPISVLAMAIFSSYYWSGFPFDNLCENEGDVVGSEYLGYHSIEVYQDKSIVDYLIANSTEAEPVIEKVENFTIFEGAPTYRYCLQDFLRDSGRQTFPFIPEFQPEGQEWMTEEQETVTTIYGWSSFGCSIAVGAAFILAIALYFLSYFKGDYEAVGDDQGQNFSELESANIYIPQVESAVFSYPLLACSVDSIDEEMLDWTDPEHPHAFYDLTKDAQALIRGKDITRKVVFSQVAHWPPEKKTN